MSSKEEDALTHASALISEIIRTTERARAGELILSVSAKDQLHALVEDVFADLQRIAEAVKIGRVSRIDGLAIAERGRTAIAAMEDIGVIGD